MKNSDKSLRKTEKQAKDLNRQFTKEVIQLAVKKCSTSVVTKERKLKPQEMSLYTKNSLKKVVN